MAEKTTDQLLTDYGYVESPEGSGSFVRPGRTSSDHYVRVDGGYEVYGIGGTMGGPDAMPWGQPTADRPGMVKIPYRQSERFATSSGLHPQTHPECFDWVWPEERIREIFEHASPVDANGNMLDNPWVKVQDEEGNVTFELA